MDRERTYAMLTAQEGSGVRARWVELPDCGNNGPLASGTIALMPDLSNAIIATCKHYTWVQPPAPPPGPPNAGPTDPAAGGDLAPLDDTAATGNDPNNPEEDTSAGNSTDLPYVSSYVPPLIYDPVMHKSGDSVASGSSIIDHQHQITQHAQGTVDAPMADPSGPKGDWHVERAYHAVNAGTNMGNGQWEALPAENLETNYVPKDAIVSASFGADDVTDIVKTAYSNGVRAFKAEDTIFPDAKPDVRKGLTIRWISNGETASGVSPKGADKAIDIPEGIPASAVVNGADGTAGASATGTK
jgi:hypothetical protein